MTDPKLRDPVENARHYRENTGYEFNASRFEEPRVKWAAKRCEGASTVLDLACNDGFFASLLHPDVSYYGIELNEIAVKNAPRGLMRAVIVGDVVSWNYADGPQYDRIVIMEVLEHLIDPAALLSRIKPALASGGRVVATSASGKGTHVEPGNNEHLREWSPREFVGLFERCGYRVLEVSVEEVYKGRYTTCVLADLPETVEDGAD